MQLLEIRVSDEAEPVADCEKLLSFIDAEGDPALGLTIDLPHRRSRRCRLIARPRDREGRCLPTGALTPDGVEFEGRVFGNAQYREGSVPLALKGGAGDPFRDLSLGRQQGEHEGKKSHDEGSLA